MTDSVDIVEFDANAGDAETELQSWLDDNSGVTSVDFVEQAYEHRNRIGVAIFYTA